MNDRQLSAVLLAVITAVYWIGTLALAAGAAVAVSRNQDKPSDVHLTFGAFLLYLTSLCAFACTLLTIRSFCMCLEMRVQTPPFTYEDDV